MDELNKLRLMAGIPVNPNSVSKKQKLVEYNVPTSKQDLVAKSADSLRNRASYAQQALDHLTNAINAIAKIPATNFDGDFAHYTAELKSLIGDEKQGFKSAVAKVQRELRSHARQESTRVRQEQEEALVMGHLDGALEKEGDLNKRADCCKYEVGQKVMRFDEPMVVVVANTQGDVVGVAPVGKETDISAIQLVPAEELEADESEGMDDMEDVSDGKDMDAVDVSAASSDEGDDVEDFDDEMSDDEDGDEEGDELDSDLTGGMDSDNLISEPIRESVATMKWSNAEVDKNESPSQLNSLGAASSTDMNKKVSVPSSVMSALRDCIKDVEAQFPRLGATETDARFFYRNLAMAFEELRTHLEGGTVADMKKAQVFVSTLMGPILHKIPAVVLNFVYRGGQKPSLKDYFKPVESKFPITGPRNKLS